MAYLQPGESNAKSKQELMRLMNMADRDLRKLVEHIRHSGVCICSSNSGYFFPETIAEVRKFRQREERRAKSIFFTLRAARKAEKEWETDEEI